METQPLPQKHHFQYMAYSERHVYPYRLQDIIEDENTPRFITEKHQNKLLILIHYELLLQGLSIHPIQQRIFDL